MSVETRKRQKYYYHKRRVNGRIQAQYFGRGPIAAIFAAADQRAADARAAERAQLLAMQDEFARLEHILDRQEEMLRLLIHAHLIIAGYHNHKGQWRLKRVKAIKFAAPGTQGMEQQPGSGIEQVIERGQRR